MAFLMIVRMIILMILNKYMHLSIFSFLIYLPKGKPLNAVKLSNFQTKKYEDFSKLVTLT